jgi:hypothetical protein
MSRRRAGLRRIIHGPHGLSVSGLPRREGLPYEVASYDVARTGGQQASAANYDFTSPSARSASCTFGRSLTRAMNRCTLGYGARSIFTMLHQFTTVNA